MKKVLVITYYWPPSGGPGVQRVMKFCKYLPEFGWEPIVLTVEGGEYSATDPTLQQEIGQNILVYKTRTFEFYSVFKLLSGKKRIPTFQLSKDSSENLFSMFGRWFRLNIVIPDARVGWYFHAVRKGHEIIRNHEIDLIFSSGPPHSIHLIAHSLVKSGLPWVTDFRDPWTDRFYYEENKRLWITQTLDKLIERKILNSATGIITVSPGFKDLLFQKMNNSEKIDIIYNGYDESDFKKTGKALTGATIQITHMGTLSKSQNPTTLFKAVEKLRHSNINTLFHFNFLGNIHPNILINLNNHNLKDITSFKGYLPHSEVLSMISDSDFLFLVIPRTRKNLGIIPGKIFEYIRSKVPILLIGPPDGDAASIIRKTHSGFVFDYDDVDSIKKILTSNPTIQPKDYQVFNRRNLTKQLVAIFNTIT